MVNALVPASAVFLALYAFLLVLVILAAATRQIKLKSRWGFILLHITLRLAAQSVGVAFGVLGYKASGLLAGYLVLGAEGYFSLVLCTARFLISYHNHVFGDSWLEPRNPDKHNPNLTKRQRRRAVRSYSLMVTLRDPDTGGVQIDPVTGQARKRFNSMGFVEIILIVANVLIVVGGSQLSGVTKRLVEKNPADPASGFDQDPDVMTSKALRAAGQAIFLFFTFALLICILVTIHQTQRLSRTASGRTHPFGHPLLLVLLCTTPFLLARGSFGVCQAVINSLNYYFPTIYGPDGLLPEFVLKETLLTTLMEWVSCALLVSTWPILRKYGYGEYSGNARPIPIAAVSEDRSASSPGISSDKIDA